MDGPRLPDPRLADDEDCLTFPLRGEPPLLQRFDLLLATDERQAAVGSAPSGCPCRRRRDRR